MMHYTAGTGVHFSDCGPHRNISTITPGFSMTITIPGNVATRHIGYQGAPQANTVGNDLPLVGRNDRLSGPANGLRISAGALPN